MPVRRRIQSPDSPDDVFGYKYVTPRDPPPLDDIFHWHHQHWQILDKGTDYLDYNGTDPVLLVIKFKQMAFQAYQHYNLERKLRANAFDAGYKFGIDDTSSFEAKSRAAINLEHKINIDKYIQELDATQRRLLNSPEFEVYKQDQNARHVIKRSFDAGYNYAKEEAFMPSAILRAAVGGPHVTQVYEHSAAKRRASLPQDPQDVKTYKQILFQILAKDRNDRLAAQAAAARAARAKTGRSNIKKALVTSLLSAAALAHSTHLYMGVNQPQPPQLLQPTQSYISSTSGMQQSLADLTRMGRGKKRTRRRHKNRK